ncbi:MAG: cytochrome c oxidase subunit 3 [Gammaproteobacteria bacterium]|nr:cytochrome c oxidase subunit 3 [Gammaproteobacteria bacterium]
MAEQHNPNHYYVPAQSKWPAVGALGLLLIAFGAATTIQQSTGHVQSGVPIPGWLILMAGIGTIIFMMIGWFGNQIDESITGKHNAQLNHSYRYGMLWFILSEVMFFAAFFGALFYARNLVMPWLSGDDVSTHDWLWPAFENSWPVLTTPDGKTSTTQMLPWGLPFINTVILVTSSITLTIAHHALQAGKRSTLNLWLFITVALGATFLFLQAHEYHEAYAEMNLTLHSGIYGNTFFMLTGFHGMHVTIGTIMLIVMLGRCLKGHFTNENHFAFEAAAWYWHFVDVVWLFLFCFVYWF